MRTLLLVGAFGLAACGGASDAPADVTVEGVDPADGGGTLAPDSTLQPGSGLAPEPDVAPEPDLEPDATLQPDSAGV